MFTREELWDIEWKARNLAEVSGTNKKWVRALQDLAYSANILDAFIARSYVVSEKKDYMSDAEMTSPVFSKQE